MIEGVVQEIFENFYSLSISMPVLMPMHQKPHVYFALDISGSMSGPKIDLAKESAQMLINSLEAEGVALTLIAFSDTVTVRDTRKIGYPGMREFCQSLGPTGGTRFVNVFAALKEEITAHNDSNTGILFLTDGCDNDGMGVLGPCMEGFQRWITEKHLLTAIHAIGLGSDHDASLLTNLIRFGTQEGTFQYVADSEELVSAVERLQNLLTVRGAWGYVRAGPQSYKISLPYNKTEGELQGTIFLKSADLKEALRAEIFFEGEKKRFE